MSRWLLISQLVAALLDRVVRKIEPLRAQFSVGWTTTVIAVTSKF